MLAPTDSTLYTCVTSQRGYRVQGARDSTNQSEGARVSDDQSEQGSSVDQSEPFSRHATRDGTADSIKDRRLHFSPFPSTTQCGAAQKHVRLPGWRHRGDTWWQGRDLYPGQSDWLTWPISRSEWLIDTWRHLWLPPGGRWRNFRGDVIEATPGNKGVTYIQVRVIDWLDLYPGCLTRDGNCFNM